MPVSLVESSVFDNFSQLQSSVLTNRTLHYSFEFPLYSVFPLLFPLHLWVLVLLVNAINNSFFPIPISQFSDLTSNFIHTKF